MKPYLFNYSETIKIVTPSISQCLTRSVTENFPIEKNFNNDVLIDETMMTESVENVDYDIYDASSTIITNVIEHSDQTIDTAHTSVNESPYVYIHKEINILSDSTLITKVLESSDTD